MSVKVRGAGTATAFVDNIDYNEKGQRTQIAYSNGTVTTYEHDEETFRLRRILTIRTSDSAKLQDLFYTYDPVGNIVEVTDDAVQTIYFDNSVVTGTQRYETDLGQRPTSPPAFEREHHEEAVRRCVQYGFHLCCCWLSRSDVTVHRGATQ